MGGSEGGGLRERTEGRMDDVFTEEKSSAEGRIYRGMERWMGQGNVGGRGIERGKVFSYRKG